MGILLLHTTMMHAQLSTIEFSNWKDTSMHTEAKGFVMHQSDGISNYLTNRIAFGGFIDSTKRWNEYADLKNISLFGYQSRMDIHADLFRSGKGLMHGVRAFFDQQILLRFDSDLYGLLFLGNSSFAGDSLELEKTDLFSMSRAGLTYTLRKGRWHIGAGIHGVTGYQNLRLENGLVYTSAGADAIHVAVDGELQQATGGLMKGAGVHTDLAYTFTLKQNSSDTSGMDIRIHLQDLGVSFIPASAINSWFANKSITWQGAGIEGLVNGDTTLFNELEAFADSSSFLQNPRDQWVILPASLTISKQPRFYHTGLPDATFGVRLRLTEMYYPFAFLGMHYVFKNLSYAGMVGSFGGFGGFQLGAYGGINAGKHIRINLSTDNLPGLFYNDMRSRSVALGIRYAY